MVARGGDLIFEVDPGMNTLNDFRHIRKYVAGDGQPGGRRRCHGADGADLVVKVPEGTVVKEAETGKVIVDMSHDCKREVILKGGRGGKGNMNYATPTMQVPKYAQPGKPGRELNVILELKTIADVGLVGFQMLVNQRFCHASAMQSQRLPIIILRPYSQCLVSLIWKVPMVL